MICPNCGSPALVKRGYCEKCGHDLSMQRKAHKLAHYYYNKGLARARIHDLYGAISMLKRSIELEKEFVDARNLLGLCYFEIGEAACALREWIVSKNIKDNNPMADRYLSIISNNQTKLKNYKLAISKYNSGLSLCRQGGFDLALIQLKKAVTLNPDYVKAWQLLAIVYLTDGDYERARKCLRRSLKTDIANPVSLRYMKEIRDERYKKASDYVNIPEPSEEDRDALRILNGKPLTADIRPNYSYRDSTGDTKVFLSLLSGILLGIMVVYFLVVPGIRQSLKQDYLSEQKKYGDEMTQYLTRMDSLEKENASLVSKLEMSDMTVNELQAKIKSLSDEKHFNHVLAMVKYFIEISSGEEEPSEFEMYMLRKYMEAVTESEKSAPEAKAMWDMVVSTYPDVLKATVAGSILFEKGKEYYDKGDNTNANKMFLFCYGESPDNEENLYHLAKTYQLLKDNTNAKKYYQEYKNKFPAGSYITEVEEWLNSVS